MQCSPQSNLPVKFRALQDTAHLMHTDSLVPGGQRRRSFASACRCWQKWGCLGSLAGAASQAAGDALRQEPPGAAAFSLHLLYQPVIIKGWWSRWRLNAAAVQRRLLSAGAAVAPTTFHRSSSRSPAAQQRLYLNSSRKTDSSSKSLVGCSAVQKPCSSLPGIFETTELARTAPPCAPAVRDWSDRHVIKYEWALNLECNSKLNAGLQRLLS
jgi:hypothetical protein